MKRTIGMGWVAVLMLAAPMAASAASQTYFGFQIGIGNAPPPPRVEFTRQPKMVLVPSCRVRVLAEADPGYDMFLYGSWYYVQKDGYWYRSRQFRGPFKVIDVRRVPRSVFDVPGDRWHHHPHGGPPGQMKKSEGRGPEHHPEGGPPGQAKKPGGREYH
jgi:hypothetical protein